jgi:hypothetical protein
MQVSGQSAANAAWAWAKTSSRSCPGVTASSIAYAARDRRSWLGSIASRSRSGSIACAYSSWRGKPRLSASTMTSTAGSFHSSRAAARRLISILVAACRRASGADRSTAAASSSTAIDPNRPALRARPGCRWCSGRIVPAVVAVARRRNARIPSAVHGGRCRASCCRRTSSAGWGADAGNSNSRIAGALPTTGTRPSPTHPAGRTGTPPRRANFPQARIRHRAEAVERVALRRLVDFASPTSALVRHLARDGWTPERGRPPSGGDGGRLGSGSGGVEPNPLSGHGGCNRRGFVVHLSYATDSWPLPPKHA